MNIIECAKMLYGNSSLRTALCDSSFRVLWKNREDIPDSFGVSDFPAKKGDEVLAFETEETVRYADGSAARITPITDGGEQYYTVELHSSAQIQDLICASSKLDELENQALNIRRMLTGVLFATAAPIGEETAEETRERISESVSRGVANVLSANVNFGFLSDLLSRGLDGTYLCIDEQLSTSIEYIRKILEADDTEFICDIDTRVTGWCDYRFLEAAVLELIINAHQYALCRNKSVTLGLHCSEDKKEYIVTVSDNGTAADVKKIARDVELGIVKPGADSHEGLGLIFVDTFCKKLGGRLELSPSETGGLRAEMILPRENSKAGLSLAMEYKPTYNNIFDPCFCILAKGADPTVYKISDEILAGRNR